MRKGLEIILKLVGSGLLVLLLLYTFGIKGIITTLGSFKWYYIVLVIFNILVGFLITYSSVAILLNAMIKPHKFLGYFRRYLTSLAIGTISPARIGDFSFAYLIKEEVPIVAGLAAVFVNKVVTLCIMLIICAVGLLFFPVKYGLFLSMGIITSLVIGLVMLKYSKKLVLRMIPKKIHIHFRGFYSSVGELVRYNKKMIMASIFIMLFKFCIDALIAYFLVTKLGVDTSFGFMLFMYAISVSTLLIPFTLNGIGLREFAVAYMFKNAGLNPATGAGVFFLCVMTNYIITIFLPFVYSKAVKKPVKIENMADKE